MASNDFNGRIIRFLIFKKENYSYFRQYYLKKKNSFYEEN